MTGPNGNLNALQEIAEILADGYIRLRSQKDSPPDRQESPLLSENVDSSLGFELNVHPTEVMNDQTELERGPKPLEDPE